MPARKKKRPLIQATRNPDDIIISVLGADVRDMTKHLSAYQKLRIDWDDYRKKLPDGLLAQWGEALIECRRHGFMGPYSTGEEIKWRMIIGDPRHSDPCTVCPKTYQEGSCAGKEILAGERLDFVPCWVKGEYDPKDHNPKTIHRYP